VTSFDKILVLMFSGVIAGILFFAAFKDIYFERLRINAEIECIRQKSDILNCKNYFSK